MHKRKKFVIYPPNYKPGDGYQVRHSRLQAWKAAIRLGEGASVDVTVYSYPKPRAFWNSSRAGLYGKSPAGPNDVAHRTL